MIGVAALLLEQLVAEMQSRGQRRVQLITTVQLTAVLERAARWHAAERALAGVLADGRFRGQRVGILLSGSNTGMERVRETLA